MVLCVRLVAAVAVTMLAVGARGDANCVIVHTPKLDVMFEVRPSRAETKDRETHPLVII
jgi:ABC-type tungstate transport system permease subunit